MSPLAPLDGAEPRKGTSPAGAPALPSPMARASIVSAVIALSVAITCLMRPLWMRFPGGAGLLEDDGYFYAQIAYNLGRQGISSFDGVGLTDGYHLLWGWLLAAISKAAGLFTPDREVHLGAMIAGYLVLLLAIGLAHARTWPGRAAIVAFGMLSSVLSEAALVAFLLLTFVRLVFVGEAAPATTPAGPAKRADGSQEQGMGAGARDGPVVPLAVALPGYVAVALLPLARIDAAAIVGVLLVGLVSQGRRREALATLAALAAGVANQLIAMKLTAGHFVSVAARAKAGGDVGWTTHLLINADKYLWVALVVWTATAVVLLWRIRAARSSRPGGLTAGDSEKLGQSQSWGRWAWVCAALGGYWLLHIVANGNVRYWYYLPGLIVCVIIVERAAVGRARRLLAWSAPAMLLALVAAKGHYNVKYAPEITYARQFVAQLSSRVPAGERIYVVDGAGFLGYASGRAVVDGDGLVNTHDYLDRLRAGQLRGYLHEQGIRYLVLNHYPSQSRVLLAYHGMVLQRANVQALMLPPPGLRKLVAFGLYRIGRTPAPASP